MRSRSPRIALRCVLAVAFVAGSGLAGAVPPTPERVLELCAQVEGPAHCARLVEGRSAVAVPCNQRNDGRILTQVPAALDCPARTKYVLIGSDFYCVSSDPSVTASTPTVLGGG